uniref:Uncharacterized protein n=1 Tax=Arundo donax TaxID=35708 RepID=A0A0A9D3R5_ARUDO
MYGLAEPSTGKSTTPATAGAPPSSPLLALRCRALSRSLRCSIGTPLWGTARSSVSAAGNGSAAAAAPRPTSSAATTSTATSGGLIGG